MIWNRLAVETAGARQRRLERSGESEKRTSRGPEALGGLDEQVLEETGVAVTEELRADEGEDGETGVQLVVVIHCHRSSDEACRVISKRYSQS